MAARSMIPLHISTHHDTTPDIRIIPPISPPINACPYNKMLLWGGPLLNLKVAVKGCKAKCDIKKLLKEDAMVVKCSSPLQIRMSQGAI